MCVLVHMTSFEFKFERVNLYVSIGESIENKYETYLKESVKKSMVVRCIVAWLKSNLGAWTEWHSIIFEK